MIQGLTIIHCLNNILVESLLAIERCQEGRLELKKIKVNRVDFSINFIKKNSLVQSRLSKNRSSWHYLHTQAFEKMSQWS